MNLSILDLNQDIPIATIEELVFLALRPMAIDYGETKIPVFFSECLAALELDIGKLYVLSVKDKPTAFGFLFDRDESSYGAPHLHILSVYKSKQGKGYGSALLKEITKRIGSEGITLECQEKNIGFFKLHNFLVREEMLEHGHYSMFYGVGQSKPIFKRPTLNDNEFSPYLDRYEKTSSRLVEKGHIHKQEI